MLFARLPRLGKHPERRSRWLILSGLLLLAACGGGGGGPSASLPPAPGTGSGGTGSGGTGSVPPTGDTTLGTPAPVTDSQINAYSTATLSWTATSAARDGSHSVIAVPMDHIELGDTNARHAWKQGWTGKDQTIAVIDDFNTPNPKGARILYSDLPIQSSQGANGKISFAFEAGITHGALVAALAGGEHQLIPEGADVYERIKPSFCADNGQGGCINGYATLNSVQPSYGVAKDATIAKVSVDLSSRQNPTATLNDIMKAVEKHHDKAAINLSLSGPVPTSLTSFAAVANDFATRGHITTKSEAVIVVALGNQRGLCRQNSMNSSKCNRIGVAFTHMDQLKDSTILVGALTGKARARYSNQAGDLKAFTLFAQDTASFSGLNESAKLGTSFAAPRVAGAAAILRHKWPKQTAAQITRLLLDTASKDIDQDGTADFTGISEVLGYGRLDLKAALSPVGPLK